MSVSGFLCLVEKLTVPFLACDQNAIRLMGGQSKFEGTVELCDNGMWKTVCDRGWGVKEARVACRQLGFSEDTRSSLIKTDYRIMIVLL